MKRSASDPNIKNTSEGDNPSIKSPADIYNRFYGSSHHLSDCDDLEEEDTSKPLKSILKKDSRSGSSENLRLKPILKSSPEHRPGTPEYTLEEPHSILKTPPDTQASEDRRPGTPEHLLNDLIGGQSSMNNRPSILKPTQEMTSPTPQDSSFSNSSSLQNEGMSTSPATSNAGKSRSILKHNQSDKRTAEASISSLDPRSVRIRSPEKNQGPESTSPDAADPRPILKTPNEWGSNTVSRV